jgi:hypothetical protein
LDGHARSVGRDTRRRADARLEPEQLLVAVAIYPEQRIESASLPARAERIRQQPLDRSREVSAPPITELQFIRKLQRLLDESDFSATYKFALLNALAIF